MVTVAVDVTIAGWFASGVIGKLINKTLSYYKDQKSWQSGMKDELDSLSRSRPQIETLFYAAERGNLLEPLPAGLEEWLRQLRDAVEEADNVLDELEYQQLKDEADKGMARWMKPVANFSKRMAQQDGALKRLRGVVRTFDALVKGLPTLAAVIPSLDERIAMEMKEYRSRETSSLISENELFGRKNEILTIISWLKSSNPAKISTFSIVGIGGVGKTVLAQHLFHHQDLEDCFQIKMWAFVSRTFDKKVITQNILESITQKKENFDTLDAAQKTLKQKLMGQKFFLVLDDVWNDSEFSRWEELMKPLSHGSEGSKILLTTRMESVANMITKVANMIAKVHGETMFLALNGLEAMDNLLLFKKYAYYGVNPNDHVVLQSIGNEIAGKLRGIPLAVKVIGGMLNNKLEYKYWDRVLKDGSLDSDNETDGIMAALRLSYEHLSAELKPCFRYFSIFPQDHTIKRDHLVDMWISIGLIHGDETRQEVLANEFFETLVRKSFFEPKDSYYIMHDLLHELAQNLSKNECLRVVSDAPIEIPQSIRHLSLRTSDIQVLKGLSELKYLRTLLLFCNIEDAELGRVIDTSLKGMKTIRCLELSSKWLRDFPKSVGDLIHLRYLCITRTNIPKLSPCVCTLYHLQILEFTLNSSFNQSERTIPADICKLSKLKRLHLPSDDISTIPRIGKLSSLQQLRYSVRGNAGYCISELEKMSELRELTITNLENVVNKEEASKAKLNLKKHLLRIALMWGHGFENIGDKNEKDKEVADGLLVIDRCQPCLELTELMLNGYRATNPPNWFNPQILPNLTTISVAYCSSLERLPSFGQLPCLKLLILESLRALKKIGLEFYWSSRSDNSFPVLETLELIRLNQLEEWSDTQSENFFPLLKRLVILDCPCLKKLPPIPTTLKELELNFLEIITLPRFKQKNEGSSTNQGPYPLFSLLIIGCSKLTSLSTGFFLNPEQLISLEELAIWNCAELVHLPSEGFRDLISLKSLRIEECRKLFLLPMLLKNFVPPSVQRVMLSSCGSIVTSLPLLLPELSLISLLKLENCANLISLPSADVLRCLKSLKELGIRNCGGLKSLGGLEAVTALKVLMIKACPSLATESTTDSIEEIPRNILSMALVRLDIDHPEILNAVPLRNLHLTKSLEIRSSQRISALPEQWLQQNGPSLHTLGLYGLTLRSVESLPDSFKNLSSLRFLALHSAYKLSRLPELPTSLEFLDIYGCSEELAATLKEGGLDYDRVRHLDLEVYGVFSQSLIAQKFS